MCPPNTTCKIFHILALVTALTGNSILHSAENMTWTYLPIDGGGLYTELLIHPSDSTRQYLRGDVPIAWRRQASSGVWRAIFRDRWTRLNGNISPEGPGGGVKAYAVHPSDTNLIYALAGEDDGILAGIWKSTDGGSQWQQVLAKPVYCNRGMSRTFGPCLAIDPNRIDTIIAGFQYDGIWRSTNAGSSWSQVRAGGSDEVIGSLNNNDTFYVGVNVITIDPAERLADGRSKHVFAGVINKGLLISSDGGNTWSVDTSFATASGTAVRVSAVRIAKASPGTHGRVWVAHEKGLTLGTWNGSGWSWSDRTPPRAAAERRGIQTLAIDPTNSDRLFAAGGLNSRWAVYRSTDGGSTWTTFTSVSGDNQIINDAGNVWAGSTAVPQAANGFTFDPTNPSRLWMVDTFHVWRTENAWASQLRMTLDESGCQNVIAMAAHALPAGTTAQLLLGCSDVYGWAMRDVTKKPTQDELLWPNWDATYVTGADHCESNPAYVWIAKDQRYGNGHLLRSTDGGASFSVVRVKNEDGTDNNDWSGGPHIAVAANTGNNLVWVPGMAMPVRYTTDGGTTWRIAKRSDGKNMISNGAWGAYNWFRTVAADRVSAGTFYLWCSEPRSGHDYSNGIFTSRDGGATWTKTTTWNVNPSPFWKENAPAGLVSVPGRAGHVWFCSTSDEADRRGVWRSTDYGATFVRVAGFTGAVAQGDRVYSVAFGKEAPGDPASEPTVWLIGRRDGESDMKLWRARYSSAISGSPAWTEVSWGDHAWLRNWPAAFAADRRTYGRVFLGGTGFYTGSLASGSGGGRTATASSQENASLSADKAIDGNLSTRWSSSFSDNQWLRIDLGSRQAVERVTLHWEGAYATSYKIQVADNPDGPWTDVYSTTAGDGGVDTISGITSIARYVRMLGLKRATPYGFSLWEFTVESRNQLPVSGAVASSEESASLSASKAVDDRVDTRWSSGFSDNQWLRLDLGARRTVDRVRLFWESAYASEYKLQIADAADGPWTTISNQTGADGGFDNLTGLSGTGRYLRILGVKRATSYGISLWEVDVFGSGSGS